MPEMVTARIAPEINVRQPAMKAIPPTSDNVAITGAQALDSICSANSAQACATATAPAVPRSSTRLRADNPPGNLECIKAEVSSTLLPG